VPVVWTNTNFKMLYMNMGHGDKVFTNSTQNKLFENGILWLLGRTNHKDRVPPFGKWIAAGSLSIRSGCPR
jgi:type 1 glutamine amidotransferase